MCPTLGHRGFVLFYFFHPTIKTFFPVPQPLSQSLDFSFSLSFFGFLGLHLQHMEASRLGVELELQLLAYTIAHSNTWILNPLSKVRDQTHILMISSGIHFCWAMTGTPRPVFWTDPFLFVCLTPVGSCPDIHLCIYLLILISLSLFW